MAEGPLDPWVGYEIGDLLLLPAEGILRRSKDEWTLSDQRCRILKTLAEAAAEAYSKPVNNDALHRQVWEGQARSSGVITQAIYDLRKFLKEIGADSSIIKTVDAGGGYYLNCAVTKLQQPQQQPPSNLASEKSTDQDQAIKSDEDLRAPSVVVQPRFERAYTLRYFVSGLGVGVGCALVAFLLWLSSKAAPKGRVAIYAPEDEELIQNVVKDSQLFITLRAFRDPSKVDKAKLQEYLVPDSAEAGTVQKILDRFTSQNLRYGDESRNEGFQVTSVTVFSPGDTAEATTIEGWYVPAYKNGQRDENRKAMLGPYRLLYQLRRMSDKKWRIERSTTPVRKE